MSVQITRPLSNIVTLAGEEASSSLGVSRLTGRGLWYSEGNPDGSRRVFTEEAWRQACQVAYDWGMRVLHPKVAHGGYLWYTTDNLLMLKSVAAEKHLLVAPTHLCYGDAYGALVREAQISSALGALFGAVCPDMSATFRGPFAPVWAKTFGRVVREKFSGGLYPVLAQDIKAGSDFPYGETNEYVSGYLPHIALGESGGVSASATMSAYLANWKMLDDALVDVSGKGLAPLYPILDLDRSVPISEVVSWLIQMGGYGYCGFWPEHFYSGYSKRVLAVPAPSVVAPIPELLSSRSTTQVSLPITPLPDLAEGEGVQPLGEQVTSVVAPPFPLPSVGERPAPSVTTQLTYNQLRLLWRSRDQTLSFDPDGSPLLAYWITLVQAGKSIGVPQHETADVTVEGERMGYITMDSGAKLIIFYATNAIRVIGSYS